MFIPHESGLRAIGLELNLFQGLIFLHKNNIEAHNPLKKDNLIDPYADVLVDVV